MCFHSLEWRCDHETTCHTTHRGGGEEWSAGAQALDDEDADDAQREGRETTPTRQDEENTGWESDFIHEDEETTGGGSAPTHEDEQKACTHEDEQKACTHEDEQKASTHEDEQKASTHEDEQKACTHEDEQKDSTHEDEQKAPTHEDEQKAPTRQDEEQTYIPGSHRMNEEVRALHEGARQGRLAFEDADRRINRYLMAAAVLEMDPGFERPDWLLLPLEDAPQAGRCVDLGPVLRGVFSRRKPDPPLQRWVEQSIPCFRKGSRTGVGTDSDPACCKVLLNLLLTFALGTYHGLTHRPPFRVRMVVYAWVHRTLTASDHELARFVQAYRNVIYLAVAEYLARLLPAVFPAEHELVQESPWNLDRVPSVADEVRARLVASVLASPDALKDPSSADRVWTLLLLLLRQVEPRAQEAQRTHFPQAGRRGDSGQGRAAGHHAPHAPRGVGHPHGKSTLPFRPCTHAFINPIPDSSTPSHVGAHKQPGGNRIAVCQPGGAGGSAGARSVVPPALSPVVKLQVPPPHTHWPVEHV